MPSLSEKMQVCVYLALMAVYVTAQGSPKMPKAEEPVLIVGGGLAGLSATIEALRNGAKVILIEREKDVGGNSAKASSGINGCGTEAQDRLGIKDSTDKFYSDTMSAGDRENDGALVDALVHESADAVQFLIDLGVDLSDINICGGHSVPRTHWIPSPKEGRPTPVGIAIIRALKAQILKEAEERPEFMKLMTNTEVLGMVTWNEYITGVRIKKEDGELDELRGKAVIMATGGFSADRHNTTSLLNEFAPEKMAFPTTNGAFARGDGIKMARAMGAHIIGMEHVQIHPTAFIDPKDPVAGTKFLAAEALRGKGALLVNSKGVRFANELGRRDYLTSRIQSEGDNVPENPKWKYVYMLMSDAMADSFGRPADLCPHQFWLNEGAMQQTATNISSGKKNQLFISLVVGHETEMLDQPTSEGYTHRWKVFVKTPGPNQLTDRSFIKKVGFRLHPDFKNPERIVRKPPFEVSEQGYGGFTIPVTVVFAEDTLKPFSFNYDLSLEMKPFSIHRRVQLLAVNEKVSPTFMEMIPKYCTGEKKKKKNKRDKEPHNETPTTSSRHNGADEKEKKKMENMPSEDSYPASPMSALFSEQKPKSRKSPEGLGSSPAPPKRSAEEKMKKIKRPKHTSSSSKATPEEPSRTPEKKNVRVLEHDLFSTALQNSAIQKMGEPRKRKNEAVDQLFFEKKTSSSNISKDTSNFQQRHTTAKRAPTHSQIAHMKNRHPGKKTPEPPKRDTNSPLSAKTSARLTESPTCSTPVSSNLSDDPQSNLSSPSTPSTSAASPGNYHSAFEIASPTLSSHEEELPSIDAESLSGQISSLSDPAVILRLAECLISSDCSHLVQISNNLLQCDLRELPFSLLSSISHILHSR